MEVKEPQAALGLPVAQHVPEGSLLNRVHHADFLEAGPLLAPERFDVVIADPPYNIGKDFGVNKDSLPLEEYVHWSLDWLDVCFDLVKDDGVVYLYGFPEIVAHIAVRLPLDKQKWLVWHYTNKTVPHLKFWQRSHETILCLWKGRRPELRIDNVREEYTEGYKKCIGKVRKDTAGRYSRGGAHTLYNGHEKGALPRDVIKQPALAGGAGRRERLFMCRDCGGAVVHPRDRDKHEGHVLEKHPTQKPMELTRRLLLSAVDPGAGKVLIPFSGTGSECVVSKQLGLDFVGFDTNSKYVEFATNWLTSEDYHAL